MPTFDGSVKTRTRVNLARDAFQPGMGMLVGSGFKEDAMIHGTRNEVITGATTIMQIGNLTVTDAANVSLTVMGTTTETHMGQFTRMIMAGLTSTVIGPEMRMNIGPVNWTCVAPVTWLNPTATMLNDGNFFESKWTNNTACLTNWTGTVSNVTLCVHNAEARVHQGCFTVFESQNEAIKVDLVAGIKNVGRTMKNSLAAAMVGVACAMGDVRAAEGDVGPHMSVPPTSIVAGN